MELLVIVLLSAAVIYFVVRFFLIKKQLKAISSQLDDYENKQVCIELVDYDLEEVVVKINKMNEHMQQIKIEAIENSAELKASIADISHDMRTPLTSIIGYLQLAKKECNDENVKNNIEIALERAAYLKGLIQDFFEISVYDLKGLTPKMDKVDLAGLLCEQILANFQSFQENNIMPYFKEADIPVFVYGDIDILTRIIQNLISNSIKYANKKVSFDILAGDTISLTVSNPTNETDIDINHIFDKFYRQEGSRNIKGTGLGLCLCKTFAESMGGRMEAEFQDGILSISMTLTRYIEKSEKNS